MKKHVKIWLITFVTLIAAGSILVGVGLSMGGKWHQAETLTSRCGIGVHIPSRWMRGAEKYSESERWHQHQGHYRPKEYHWKDFKGENLATGDFNSVTRLDIELTGLEDVQIVSGKEYGLYLDGVQTNMHNYVKDGEWHIEISHRKPFGRMQIVIPKDAKFEDVELELDAGVLSADRLETDKLNLEMTAGSMSLSNVNCKNAEIEMTAGEMIIEGTVSDKVKTELTAGSFTWSMPRPAGYSYQVEKGFGKVTIDEMEISGLSNGSGKNGQDGPCFEVECMAGNAEFIFEDVI